MNETFGHERNFCERCGKRLGKNAWDVHTCSPPEAEKQKPLFKDLISQHEGLAEELAAMDSEALRLAYAELRRLHEENERLKAVIAEAGKQEPVAWRNAALRIGEDLCSVGPFGYYDMTAEQWLDWALSVVTVHAPPPSPRNWKEEMIEAMWREEMIEAMKQDFETWWHNEGSKGLNSCDQCDLEEHCKRMCEIAWSNGAYKAIADAEKQEPVAWMRDDEMKAMVAIEKQAWIEAGQAELVEEESQRQWVGLTDEQKDAARYRWLRDNSASFTWIPSRYNENTVSGFSAFGTGYLGFGFEAAVDLAIEAAHGIGEKHD